MYPPSPALMLILFSHSYCGHISISDLDQGDNGRISWSLESNESISIQKLFNNEAFLMFTSRIFDREDQSYYNISLTASDHGQSSHSNTLNFTLIILDENDNTPKFDEDFYSINITEITPINTILLHIHATDADENNTLNSQIEYHLENQTIFAINSTTGHLYLIDQLDREKQSTYELDIIAFDHGQPRPLSSTVRCLIHVIDINDNYPIFDLSEYIFEIPETWSHLSPIGHVHATDIDEYYGELSYRLVHNETTMIDEWPFELTSNGTLYLKATSVGLDYEQHSIYQFLIIAIDNNGFNTSVSVTIYILNRNDYCPELLNNSTVLFYNIDLWSNNSISKSNQFILDLFDGDNDTCTIELLNFNDIFHIETIERNQFILEAQTLPEREYYILQFRLRDQINETIDQSCIREIELVLTTGTNQTNQTIAMDTAREYLDALHLISQHKHSYFDLTLLNFILIFILLSIAIIIGLISIKLVYLSSNSRHRRKFRNHRNETNLLYRLQGPTDTQLPLLANGPGEQSLTSSLIISPNNRLSQDEASKHSFPNDDQQQTFLYQLNSTVRQHSNDFKTFAMKSNNSAYDIIGDIIHSNVSSYPQNLNNDYESTSINLDQSRLISSENPSNVSLSTDGQLIAVTYSSAPMPIESESGLSSSTLISRTLKTFSHNSAPNGTKHESFRPIVPRLAEQEVIEV
ncbi:hypothetical protein I4U23_024711 [Adineta vaga]|nr:hypothetical protein I4U23_024711 [Adineta vaga]